MKYVLLFISTLSVVALLMIAFFIFRTGLPVILKTGLGHFLFSTDWTPTEGRFGIGSMILGTIYVTLGALILGIPLGIGTAVFLAEIAPKGIVPYLKSAIELLAGIPSTIYGFFGLIILVPLISEYFGGTGFSIFSGAIILAIMILPTIISIAVDAIRAVPQEYKEGSYALGANVWQTITRVIIPAASSGIIAAVVLGMGRALGETMAVLMVIGNATSVPHSMFDSTRTLTSNIAVEMGYASGEHQQALFATGIVLFVFIILLNVIANRFIRREIA